MERRGRLEPVDIRFRDAQHLVHIAQRIAGRIGRRIDESSPMVDARLPDGSRVNIIIPPLALDGAVISIRRFVMQGSSLEDMAERQVLSPAMAELFRIGVRARLNILISGGTGAGKTTFMNALSREIPDGERLITIEDAAELQMQQPHVVRLETRTMSAEGTGQVTMRDLLMNTLRMRPDRIIVGEVRGAEANEMLQAMNTGHPGSMCTLHANNPRDALIRLENMLMAGGGDIPLPALRRQIAGSIDLVVQLARLRSGHRCVTSVTNVVGIENDIVTTEEMWRRRPTPVGRRARARVRDLGPVALVDGGGGRGEPARAADGRAPGRSADRGGGGVTPLDGAFLAAGATAAGEIAIAASIIGWRRGRRWHAGRDKVLLRRMRRAAAPLTNALASDLSPGEEQHFSCNLSPIRAVALHREPLPAPGIPPCPSPPYVGAGLLAAAAGWFAIWFLKIPTGGWTLPLAGLAGAGGVWSALGWLQARQEAEFIRVFPEIVDQVVRLAGAGVPSMEALSVVTEDAPKPVGPILRGVCDGLLAGLDPDVALRTATERIRMAEFTMFAAVIRLQRRSGGGVSTAFSNLSKHAAGAAPDGVEGARLHRAEPPHPPRPRRDAGAGAAQPEGSSRRRRSTSCSGPTRARPCCRWGSG